MNEHDPVLKIRFDGRAVGPGKIPVPHLLMFLTNLNKALQRTGRVLMGSAESVQRGQPPRNIKEEVALDLVLLTHGSPAAVLGFDRKQTGSRLPNMDFGVDILEKAVLGLAEVQGTGEALPEGYDRGVLMAWRDAGTLFSRGVERIELTLRPTSFRYSPAPENDRRCLPCLQCKLAIRIDTE